MKLLPLAAILMASHAFAQAPTTARGTFSSEGAKFTVAGAVAFNGKSAFDPDTRVIQVAISNTALHADAINDFVDRKRAIDKLVKDDETPVVYFEFAADGRWRGLSYYFGPGNGCGYCTSEVRSTVKLANGRLSGAVKGTEKGRPFDVTLDLAVMGDDHGAALPADGGAPGKAYLAYHAALVKPNATALKLTLSPGNLEVFDRAQTAGTLPGFLEYLSDKHPVKGVRITRAWAGVTKASLLIEGSTEAGKVVGEVFLVNVNGKWGVDEELIELVIGQ